MTNIRVRFETTAGPFVVEVNPEWAPRAATQFRELVEAGFYNENRFFRVVPNFVVQFGINGDPEEHQKWSQPIPDEPVVQSNTKGTITFAKGGPDTRPTQLFINLKDNSSSLDPQGFPAFGQVVEGMENVEKINPEYGEKPDQGKIQSQGNVVPHHEFSPPGFHQVRQNRAIKSDTTPTTSPAVSHGVCRERFFGIGCACS